mgnify:CR=1 FL=1
MVWNTSSPSVIKREDRWDREIELQKAYNLSPSEASLLVSKESGMSSSEIAELEGLNVQTVKNTISKARKKLNGNDTMDYYITRLSSNTGDNAMIKSNLSMVLAYICSEMGYDVRIMKHTIHIKGIPRNVPGDKRWFVDNIERKVDMLGTRSDIMASERAKRVKFVYDTAMSEQKILTPMFGHIVLKYYLDKYNIAHDIVEEE